VKPFATSLAFNLSIFPLESCLALETHLEPTVLAPLGISIKSHTPLMLMDFISSFIARNKERKKKYNIIIIIIINVAYFHGSLSHKFINILHNFTKSPIRQTCSPWAEAVVASLVGAASRDYVGALGWAVAASRVLVGPPTLVAMASQVSVGPPAWAAVASWDSGGPLTWAAATYQDSGGPPAWAAAASQDLDGPPAWAAVAYQVLVGPPAWVGVAYRASGAHQVAVLHRSYCRPRAAMRG
jgi:hypothetical protein